MKRSSSGLLLLVIAATIAAWAVATGRGRSVQHLPATHAALPASAAGASPAAQAAPDPENEMKAVDEEPPTSSRRGSPPATEGKSSWKVYASDMYPVRLRYPPNWTVTRNVADPSLPVKPLEVVNLVSGRTIGSKDYLEPQNVVAVIAAYPKPSGASLSGWLETSYSKDLENTTRGRIQDAVSRADSGSVGIISFDQSENEGQERAEFGRAAGGVLFYTAVFTGKRSSNVIAVELHLVMDETARPSDEECAGTFDEILSTVTVQK